VIFVVAELFDRCSRARSVDTGKL